MADPFSLSVGVLQVLGTAAETTRVLYELFSRMSEAQVDVKNYCGLLKALLQAFSSLYFLHAEKVPDLILPEDLLPRLVECANDLQAIRLKIERLRSQPGDSLFKKGARNLRWAVRSDAWLDKFSKRLQIYHFEFSLKLETVQLRNQAVLMTLLNQQSERQASASAGQNHQTFSSTVHVSFDSQSVSHHSVVNTYDLQVHRSSSIYDTRKSHLPHRTQRLYLNSSKGCLVAIDRQRTYRHSYHFESQFLNRSRFETIDSFYNISVSVPLFWGRRLALNVSLACQIIGSNSFALALQLQAPRIVPATAPVIQFAGNGDIASLNALLCSGNASIHDELCDGTTLLHIAVLRGHTSLVKFLVSKGARVNATDEDLDTPLHYATVSSHDYEIMRTLLQNGGDTSAINCAGRTPLHQYSNHSLRQLLMAEDGPIDVFAADCDGMTIAHYISYSKSTSPAELHHLTRDAPSCLTLRDELGRSPLDLAAMRGNCQLVSYVLNLGVHSASALVNQAGTSLLHYATYSKRTDVLEIVASRLPDIAFKDHHGRSALHSAVMRKNNEAFQKILDLGGEKLQDQPDHFGETPIQMAKRLCEGGTREPTEAEISSYPTPVRGNQDAPYDYSFRISYKTIRCIHLFAWIVTVAVALCTYIG